MQSTIGERLVLETYPSNIIQEHIARYKFAAKYAAGKRVLDIACGTGYGSKILIEAGAKEVIGVDISQEALDHATKEYRCENLEYSVGDCQSIPFPDRSFDLIVSFETLEHIDCYQAFVDEVSRVLKVNGEFIVSTPNKELCSPNSEQPLNPYHVKEFTLTELNALMRTCFSEICVFGMKIDEKKKGLVSKMLDKIPVKVKYIVPIILQNSLSKILRKKISVDDVIISRNCINDARFFVAVCSNNKD